MATKTYVAKVPLSITDGRPVASIIPIGETFELEETAGAVLVEQDEAELVEEKTADEDYTSWLKPALVAEAEKRGLVVTGTGADGNVLADDLRLALLQDDIDNKAGK